MLTSTTDSVHGPRPSQAEHPKCPCEPRGKRCFAPAVRFLMRWSVALLLASVLIVLHSAPAVAAADDKPRLLVLTDIGGDPDDQQSLVRLMLYANEFEIEGLIASASGTPGELKESVTKPELIREIVEAYGQVRDHLALHADGYPPVRELLDRIKTGS